MPISPGAPHTLPVGFLAPCSRLPGCAGCTSSPTCSVCWCAGDGPAPQTGWGPLHVPSWTHALPRRMFGHPLSSVYGGVHWHVHAAWGSSSLAHVYAWALHARSDVPILQCMVVFTDTLLFNYIHTFHHHCHVSTCHHILQETVCMLYIWTCTLGTWEHGY